MEDRGDEVFGADFPLNRCRAHAVAAAMNHSAANAAAVLLAAQAVNWGPIQYKGELYDRASYRYYWITLQRARLSGVPVSAEAEAAFFA